MFWRFEKFYFGVWFLIRGRITAEVNKETFLMSMYYTYSIFDYIRIDWRIVGDK